MASVRLPAKQFDELQAVARSHYRTVSAHLRMLVEQHLEEEVHEVTERAA